MAEGHTVDTTWMWHPSFSEHVPNTAGRFVHFSRRLDLPVQSPPPHTLRIAITADTRYKLYINLQCVGYGPVKGDRVQWYSDELDIAPFMRPGANIITVRVLRFFFATSYATSFPRLPTGGLRITTVDLESPWRQALQSSSGWKCTIDTSTILRIDEPEDDFLHVYEHAVAVGGPSSRSWVPAKVLEFMTSTGNSAPWNLVPCRLPQARTQPVQVRAVHNVQSCISTEEWATILTAPRDYHHQPSKLLLQHNTTHCFDIEVDVHTTGFIKFNFDRPSTAGAKLRVRYAESYEDEPRLVPYLRTKGDRRDTKRGLYGPEDLYEFQGPQIGSWPSFVDTTDATDSIHMMLAAAQAEENYEPFHWRTFRFVRLTVEVGSTDLIFRGIDITSTQYPLDVSARFDVSESLAVAADSRPTLALGLTAGMIEQLWTTSIRTLNNCMHDCYEDCPFYEQLQYAMDTRSSCLFTYYLSADDRLACQAITQLHNSFDPLLGLTASRAPSHNTQHIPHFSLYWVCMLSDHFVFVGNPAFIRTFLPVADAVLGYFDNLIDKATGLIRVDDRRGLWHFTDWVDEWRPYGIPPDATRTGFSTYTNCLYGFALRQAAVVVRALGRSAVADEYLARADSIARAVAKQCFDGSFFTDGLADAGSVAYKKEEKQPHHQQQQQQELPRSTLYSQHSQVWAVLSGAATAVADSKNVGATTFSQNLLRATLGSQHRQQQRQQQQEEAPQFIPTSISMSHYTFRALSKAGGTLYDDYFLHGGMWAPWKSQLALNLTTWEEDGVSQRSDCHAWGSTPVYEFLTEVAGLLPLTAARGSGPTMAVPSGAAVAQGAGGWLAGIVFQPRLRLAGTLHASVPIRRSRCDNDSGIRDSGLLHGEAAEEMVDLLVHVSWAEVPKSEHPASCHSSSTSTKVVRLWLENRGVHVEIPLVVKLPGRMMESFILSTDRLEFDVTLEEDA